MNMMMIIPVCAVLALVFAVYLAGSVRKEEEGTDRMKEIAGAIREGANAFLFSEYKVLVIFAAILFVVIGFGIGNWITAVCFLVGAVFSTLAGFFGMRIATEANVRTANAARTSGMAKALAVAYHGGAVMGFSVVGLGLLGISVIYLVTGDASVLFGYSLGASSVALFARVGGGIYTKAADVGADLVIMSVTWPVWARISSSLTSVPSSLRLHSVFWHLGKRERCIRCFLRERAFSPQSSEHFSSGAMRTGTRRRRSTAEAMSPMSL